MQPRSDAGATPMNAELSREEIQRYSRQLIMPEVGVKGQRALKAARVLVIGAGGLGCPALMYLAAAGVGTLGMVEYDTVDASNLQRQILFDAHDVGRSKLQVAGNRIRAQNPAIEVHAHAARISADNAVELIRDYDIVIDATDNFPSRYLINDACVILGKPDISASILRYEAQLSVFWTGRGPCYRCLFPVPPPAGLAPSCAEAGVIGALPGIVGSMQANEAIKLILDVGEPLIGRLLVLDALTMRFSEMSIQRSPDCPRCFGNHNALSADGYEPGCQTHAVGNSQAEVPADALQVAELKQVLDRRDPIQLVDVRSPAEYELARLDGALLLPMGELEERLHELSRSEPIVCYCHKGSRSRRAAALLKEKGFAQVFNLEGGIDAWSAQVDSSVPRY